jgi:Gas vesicle synthesis protein GvpL/GvpF
MKSVFYLYGITPAGPEFQVTAPGVDGVAAVEAVEVTDLAAWYSRVDAREFGEELAQRMENLEWLADMSVRHQRVVALVAAQSAIVPARFGTIFLTLQNLKKDVAGRVAEAKATLDRIADAEEWGVKVLRRAPPVAMVTANSGAEYLRKKAALQTARQKTVSDEVNCFADELSKIAKASAPIGRLSSSQRDLEWQAAFLVAKSRKHDWDAILRRYASEWAESREIECSGPWPPYSFV